MDKHKHTIQEGEDSYGWINSEPLLKKYHVVGSGWKRMRGMYTCQNQVAFEVVEWNYSRPNRECGEKVKIRQSPPPLSSKDVKE